MSDTLQDLVNRAIFLSAETQAAFGSRIAGADWDVDFGAESPTLRFATAEPLEMRVHMLGSEAAQTQTWHWGWDNINGFPAPVVELSHAVRQYGAQHGISEFTTEEIDLDDELALRLTLAAKPITGHWGHYPADAGGGTSAWLLVEHPLLALGEPAIRDLVRSLAQGLTETEVSDHRAALLAYAEQRGFPLAELPDGSLRMLAADGSADVTFDEHNRITNCALHQPLEGEAAEQFADRENLPAPEALTPHQPAPGSQPAPATPAPEADAPEADAPAAGAQPVAEPTPEASVTESASAPAEPAAEPTSEAAEPAPATEPAAEPTRAPAAEPAPASDAGTEPTPEPASEPVPEAASEPAAPAADEPAPAPAPAPTPEQETKEKPKKKGFFKKLFGG